MITYNAISCTGDREKNEDSYICLENGGNFCFVVADGLGGHCKGEIASRMLVEAFQRIFETGPANTDEFLKTAFDTAQEEIISAQKSSGAMFEMMTTAVALIIIDGKCRWGHIGDSRLYLFHGNKVKTRTLDHSVPQMLALSKKIREKQIARHPDRNRLLRAVGVQWDSPRYELSEEYDLEDCQAFLLCSDGFWELIDKKKMEVTLKKSPSDENWLAAMTQAVTSKGYGQDMDNYTAIAIRIGS